MDQACAVRDGEGLENRSGDGSGGVRGHRAAFAQQLAQRAALDELHDQEGVLAVAALVVDADQPGMVEPGYRAGLELEAREELRIGGELWVHHLDRDRSVQTQVHAAVHGGHAAARDGCIDAVAPIEHHTDQSSTSGIQARAPSFLPQIQFDRSQPASPSPSPRRDRGRSRGADPITLRE